MAEIQNFHSILIPARVYTGDRAELRCTFTSAPSLVPEPVVSTLSYESGSVTVYGLELSETVPGTYVLSVEFQVWQPGSVVLPELSAGPFTVEFPAVTVLSIAQTGRALQLQPMRPPLVVPGTAFQLYGIITVSVAVLAAAFVLLRYFRRGAAARAAQKKSRRRLSRVRRSFAKFRRQLRSSPVPANEWCGNFERTVREYLAAAFPIPAAAYTAAEIRTYFALMQRRFADFAATEHADAVLAAALTPGNAARYAPLAASAGSVLEALFLQADAVRFGNAPLTDGQYTELPATFERLLPDCEQLAAAVALLPQEDARDI